MFELFAYEFMQRAIIGAILIGMCCGLIGPFLVLRRLSLLGDGLAHLAFGGIAFGFLFGISPIISSFIFAVIGGLVVKELMKKNIYGEASIALVLSFGVGLGILVIGATRGFGVDIFSYFIGSLSTLSQFDVIVIALISVVLSVFLLTSYRYLLLQTFHQDMALNRHWHEYAFTIMSALVVVIAIRAVGILLVTALIVLPTLIALRFASSFFQTVIFAVGLSIFANLFGIILSYYLDLPPSGVIVMSLFCIFLVSLLKR
ncbi:MAG: metal ABC transporter permease [Candidatus Woesearchaeota archaeon]